MSTAPAFARAAEIEASLEQLAELCEDPTPLVYKRLFELQPQMEPYFWRDTNNAIKGEMLSRTFATILDFIGERRYGDHMIETEIINHEGYDVPREVFATFFAVVRDTVGEVLGPAFTPQLSEAWDTLLAEINVHVGATPRNDVVSEFHAARVAAFQRGEPLS